MSSRQMFDTIRFGGTIQVKRLVTIGVVGVAAHLVLGGFSAYAAVTTAAAIDDETPIAPLRFDAALAAAQMKNLATGRKVASLVDPNEGDFKQDFADFSKEFYAVNNPESLTKLIRDYSIKYATLSPETQLVVAHLRVLAPFRGIFYRLRKIFEKNDPGAVHSSVVTALRGFAASMGIFLPTEQWRAGFDFLSIPSREDAESRQFTSIRDFQDHFLKTRVNHALNQAIVDLTALYNTSPKILVDSKLAYGTGTFPDKVDRFKVVDAGELSFDLANFEMAQFRIHMFCAYNHDDILEASESYGRLAGINGFLPGALADLGLSSRDRVKQVMNKYPTFLEKFEKDKKGGIGDQEMATAYVHLTNAISYAKHAWEFIGEKREPGPYDFLKTASIRARAPDMARKFKTIDAMISGNEDITSRITGKPVKIKLENFFTNPPANLHAFLPTHWDESPKQHDVFSKSGKKLTFRDYYRGKADAWDTKAWEPYVPSAKGKGPTYVADVLNTLKTSWGGEFLLRGVSSFVY